MPAIEVVHKLLELELHFVAPDAAGNFPVSAHLHRKFVYIAEIEESLHGEMQPRAQAIRQRTFESCT